MAQVPVYGGPQVRSNALQPVQQREIDVSSGMRALAGALGNVGGEIDKVVQRDAQDEAFKLEGQLRQDWQQHRAKLRENYKGDQAEQYAAAASEWWKEAPQKYGSTASPLAQRLAGRSLANFRLQAEADTLGYVEGEKKRSRSTNYQVLQQGLMQEALTSVTPANAAAVGEDISKRITENAIRYATAEGTPDAGPVMAKDQLIKYHSNVALSLAGRPGGADAAKAYLSQFGGSMETDDRTRVLDLIDVEAQKAKAIAVRDMSGTLLLGIERGQFPRAADIDALARVDPTAAAAVQRAMKAEIASRKAEVTGRPIQTDPAAYLEVKSAIMSGQITDPKQLLPYKDRIGISQLDDLSDMMQKRKSPQGQDALFTLQQRVEKALPGLNIDPKKDPEAAYAISTEVDRRIRAASVNKKLTPDDEQKIVDDVLMDRVYVDEIGRDPEKPVAMLTPDELAKAYVNVDGRQVKVSVVPKQDRIAITEKRRARGLPVTEEAIVRAYLARQAADKKPAGKSSGGATGTF